MRYQAFGLSIRSTLDLGALPAAAVSSPSDVQVLAGPTPNQLDDVRQSGLCYQAGPQGYLFHLDSVGRFFVSGGRRIVVEPAAGADPQSLRLFLFGSVFGALLHQRGTLVLHASAVATPSGAILVAGPSGAGKSTLCAELRRRGCPVIADDVCALAPGESGPITVYPGYPRLKLWADAAAQLAIATDTLLAVRPNLPKYEVPVADAHPTPLPVRAVILLNPDSPGELSLTAVTGFAKLGALAGQVYRANLISALRGDGASVPHLAPLAQQVRVLRVSRPKGAFPVGQLAEAVLSQLP